MNFEMARLHPLIRDSIDKSGGNTHGMLIVY